MVNAPRGLLLVHAHPDDESLATGGVIAHYAALGVRVTVVTCTLGEEGEVIPAELRGLDVQHADQLGGYRVHELREACRALGVAEHRFLGGIGRWRDSGMVGTEANEHPRAFVAGSLDEQAATLAQIVAEVRPDVVVSYDSNGGYGHPDHIRAHEVTKATVLEAGDAPGLHAVYWVVWGRSVWADGVAALAGMAGLPYQVPAQGVLPTVPDDVVTTAVDIGAALPAKVEAIRAHATQVAVWDGGRGQRAYALSDGVARPLCAVEQFAFSGGVADPDDVRTDLFGGMPGCGTTSGTTR